MNKNFLICGAIAAALLLTACVKKEAPKEDEQEKVETTQPTEQVNEPVQLQPLDSAENTQTETPAQVEIERQETENTTTVIRREVTQPAATEAPKAEAPKAAAPKAEAPKAEEKPAQATPSKSSSASQSEDDAVAAAIAAATPALEN
ncbi:internalin [Acinetobacter sp. TSRC1-2]|uniref:internalin n=1 Tax=unclassified Acinetobacter TaxID=196816 RepID=UPI003CF0F0DB